MTTRRAKAGDMYLKFLGCYQATDPGLDSYSGVTPGGSLGRIDPEGKCDSGKTNVVDWTFPHGGTRG
jgi:hypothetical protein